jgi:hypothetical protein
MDREHSAFISVRPGPLSRRVQQLEGVPKKIGRNESLFSTSLNAIGGPLESSAGHEPEK